jgi:hypothetical protein
MSRFAKLGERIKTTSARLDQSSGWQNMPGAYHMQFFCVLNFLSVILDHLEKALTKS